MKWKYNKPGNVFPGVVSRLDTRVTGVIVFARTSKAASRLNEQFRNRTTEKRYWALTEQAVSPAAGEWTDYIRKEDEGFKVRVVRQPDVRSKLAKLRYETKFAGVNWCLLEVQLLTGRKHQIRAQLAAHGRPILGDKKYGSRCAFPTGVALHSRRLTIQHPTQTKHWGLWRLCL
ncbi:MAG: RNA pseudouridine synthase [Pirellulaceae bacterium]